MRFMKTMKRLEKFTNETQISQKIKYEEEVKEEKKIINNIANQNQMNETLLSG